MLYPTINKLTKGKFNRYQLAVATAKCARLITDEYVRERHIAEKAALGVKDADKTADNIVNPDYRDRKAVKIAIDKIESGEYDRETLKSKVFDSIVEEYKSTDIKENTAGRTL